MRRKVKSTGPTPKLESGRDGNDRAAVVMVEHFCKNNGPHCEPVFAPKNVSEVICGRCVQKMVGGGALPPERKEKKA